MVFHFFGFDSSILKRSNLFCCHPESCVLNKGWASNFFEIQRRVRQGCPLSPYLFVLSVEELAKAIRENKSILIRLCYLQKGIFVNSKEICRGYNTHTRRIPNGLSALKLKGAQSRFAHFEKFSLNYLNSSFAIRVNLRHP